MKNALKEKMNESLPSSLRKGIFLKPKNSHKGWWLTALPVALVLAVVYYNNQTIFPIERTQVQDEAILDDFIQDMADFDKALEDDLATYL